MTPDKHPKLIKRPEVLNIAAFKKSTLYNKMKSGTFVPSISLGPRAVAWVESEVNAVISAMIAEQTQAEIKALVAQLVAQRKAGAV